MAKHASKVAGGAAIQKMILSFAEVKVRNSIIRSGIAKAAREVRNSAKSRVVEDTGLLKYSIRSKSRTKNGTAYAVVGPGTNMARTVFRKRADGTTRQTEAVPTKYAHLIEFGTAHSAPKPFLRPAWDSVDKVKIMRDKWWQMIMKHVDKNSKRTRPR